MHVVDIYVYMLYMLFICYVYYIYVMYMLYLCVSLDYFGVDGQVQESHSEDSVSYWVGGGRPAALSARCDARRHTCAQEQGILIYLYMYICVYAHIFICVLNN